MPFSSSALMREASVYRGGRLGEVLVAAPGPCTFSGIACFQGRQRPPSSSSSSLPSSYRTVKPSKRHGEAGGLEQVLAGASMSAATVSMHGSWPSGWR